MNIINDTITFDAADFAGLSDFARKAIASRIGTLDDYAIELGVIVTRSLEADKSALHREISELPEVKTLVDTLAVTYEPVREKIIAEEVVAQL